MADDDPVVIRVTVPGPPRQTDRVRHRIVAPAGKAAFVNAYSTTAQRNQMAVIRDFAQQAMGNRPPLEGPIDLRCACYFAVPDSWSKKKREKALRGLLHPTGRPDWDNLAKMPCDAMLGIVFRDDSQITDAAVWKRYSMTPRVVIEVRQCEPTAE